MTQQFVSKGNIGIKLKELTPDEPSAISEEQFEIVSKNYEKEKTYIPKSKTLKELGLQNYVSLLWKFILLRLLKEALQLLYFKVDALKFSKEPLPVTPSNAYAFLVPSSVQDSWNVTEGDVFRVVKANNKWCLVEKMNDFVSTENR